MQSKNREINCAKQIANGEKKISVKIEYENNNRIENVIDPSSSASFHMWMIPIYFDYIFFRVEWKTLMNIKSK